MQMFGSVIKEYYKNDDRKVVSVAIMPCTAKKFEAARDEFKIDGIPNIDYVLTTRELIHMVMESGILFNEVEEEAVDMPFGISSGAGVIFGVTGGVTEAVVRRVSEEKTNASLKNIAFKGVRGLKGVKEFILPVGENKVRIAIVSGLKNADTLIKKIQSGEVEYDFIEVMACPNGCISGAGQPHAKATLQEQRMEGLYEADRMSTVKRSEENPLMDSIYDKVIKGKEHEMLHVHYHSK